MIWLVFACLSLACALYICAPLYAPRQPSEGGADNGVKDELKTYLAEIAALEQSDMTPEQVRRKTELERRVLAVSTSQTAAITGPARGWLAAVTITIIGGSALLYSVIGRPDLTDPQAAMSAQQSTSPQIAQDFVALTDELGRRLAADPSPAEGWQIYARSLMRLSRYDEAMAAYDEAYTRSEDKTLIGQEREQAREFIALQTAPRPNIPIPEGGDVDAVMAMDAESQALMIQGMVEGLAARLENNPDDAQGWTRLLTARQVLGDEEKLAVDIAAMRTYYAEAPDTVRAILSGSGLPAN